MFIIGRKYSLENVHYGSSRCRLRDYMYFSN